MRGHEVGVVVRPLDEWFYPGRSHLVKVVRRAVELIVDAGEDLVASWNNAWLAFGLAQIVTGVELEDLHRHAQPRQPTERSVGHT